jgi:hypothetical protein
MTGAQELALVKQHISQLMEHFDSVQIFATRFDGEDDGNTRSVQAGDGNYYARYGHVVSWLKDQENASPLGEEEDA